MASVMPAGTSNPRIHMVALGLGVREHLTIGAAERLAAADYVYVMANEKSWMVSFAVDIAGKDKVRTYMPATVSWGAGWARDPVFERVADEVAGLVAEGRDVVFAMAGDVAIFGNIADSMVPCLQARGLTWDVYPGVSFLNAISLETGVPLIGEEDHLAVTYVPHATMLEEVFRTANVVVLYNPGDVDGLREYIAARGVHSALMVFHGVYGKRGTVVDLSVDLDAPIRGLVVLRRLPEPGAATRTSPLVPPADKAAETSLARHVGVNAWDAQGRLFALAYPDRLLWAPDGDPRRLEDRFHFAQRPGDARGLFIDSGDHLFVGLKGHVRGAFGRTYRSEDAGESFTMVLDRCFWGMDEDAVGNLFAGVYHESNEADVECALYWSSDGGHTWTDIAASDWREQFHVHYLAVNPATGWLYATLGDVPGLNGCWRCRPQVLELAEAIPAGGSVLRLASVADLARGDVIVVPGTGRVVVEAVDRGAIRCAPGCAVALEAGARLLRADWTAKFGDYEGRQQYCGIAFDGKDVYLADDNGPARNPGRVLVYRARDDGDDRLVEPTPVLLGGPESGWGAFFLERDRSGRWWTAARPVGGPGTVWTSIDGTNWSKVCETLEEDIPCWRGTHTFRDGTLGQTGDGRSLGGPRGEMVVPYLNRARVIGP